MDDHNKHPHQDNIDNLKLISFGPSGQSDTQFAELRDAVNAIAVPAARIFPLLPDDELTELANDIEQRGLREPIRVDRHERIVDGRNRWVACKLAHVSPTFATVAEGTDITALIISSNLRRRHLSTAQRTALAVEIVTLGSANLPITQVDAAKMAKVSTRNVGKGIKIKKAAPALVAALTADTISVDAAEHIANIADESLRQEAIAAVAAGEVATAKASAKPSRNSKHRTSFVYAELFAALDDLPQRVAKYPPDQDLLMKIHDAFASAIKVLRAHEESLAQTVDQARG